MLLFPKKFLGGSMKKSSPQDFSMDDIFHGWISSLDWFGILHHVLKIGNKIVISLNRIK